MRASLRIGIVTPARRGSHAGNRVTAERWARLLQSLGHQAAVTSLYQREPFDLLVALHARKSFPSVRRFRRERPDSAIVVALTGTDLYADLRKSVHARRSLEIADRLVLLQSEGRRELPAPFRTKARVIHQSAVAPRGLFRPRANGFDVVVLSHLRAVKDPLRAAKAARLLPGSSRLRVLHAGAALSTAWAQAARREEKDNPRYRWLGPRSHSDSLRLLARARALILTSRLEGGANVVSEALACSIPVVSSRIPGSVGLLGRGYPGYFEVGDTHALAALFSRLESDPAFLRRLRERVRVLGRLVSPARERASWMRLLRELRRGSREN
ncbi:MAG: selenoneine biosynthesis selenosugar synthase SenB [Vicinamibacteria bacterium]